jgi:hypothetical protein
MPSNALCSPLAGSIRNRTLTGGAPYKKGFFTVALQFSLRRIGWEGTTCAQDESRRRHVLSGRACPFPSTRSAAPQETHHRLVSERRVGESRTGVVETENRAASARLRLARPPRNKYWDERPPF